jgi:hypothetical protein
VQSQPVPAGKKFSPVLAGLVDKVVSIFGIVQYGTGWLATGSVKTYPVIVGYRDSGCALNTYLIDKITIGDDNGSLTTHN